MTAATSDSVPSNQAFIWQPVDEEQFDLLQWEFRLAEAEALATELTYEAADEAGRVDYFLPHDFKLSVIVPVYNEEQTIATVVQRLLQLPFRTEIVIVDDCSTDGTRDVLARLAHFCDLKIAYHPRNRGKGAAIRTGLPNVTGDIVAIQDADLEYDPQDLIDVIRPLAQGQADVCYGSRFLSQGSQVENSSWIHRCGNRLLTILSNCLTGLRLTDMETCYKAFHRSVIQSVKIQQDRFGFEPEITAKLARRGLRFAECPISYHARDWQEGKKIGWKDGLEALACILWYRCV